MAQVTANKKGTYSYSGPGFHGPRWSKTWWKTFCFLLKKTFMPKREVLKVQDSNKFLLKPFVFLLRLWRHQILLTNLGASPPAAFMRRSSSDVEVEESFEESFDENLPPPPPPWCLPLFDFLVRTFLRAKVVKMSTWFCPFSPDALAILVRGHT